MTASTPLLSEPLFRFAAEVSLGPEVERGGGRALAIAGFTGGWFKGPRVAGRVLPFGGDWAELEGERLVRISVRAVLEADDGAPILMAYNGSWQSQRPLREIVAPGGHRLFRNDENLLRVAARFETDAAAYRWLNTAVAVGIGAWTERGIEYDFHHIL